MIRKRNERVLITGGAGFIGSHTADALVKQGYTVRILDALLPPVHKGTWPNYMKKKGFELIYGDVRSKKDWMRALKGVDYVYHLAALQDQLPEFGNFFTTNTVSTALLYELLASREFRVKKVIVISSQFVYGDGAYQCMHGKKEIFFPELRPLSQFKKHAWDIRCPHKKLAHFIPFQEDQKLSPTNSYGLSKLASENLALRLGKTYGIPTTVLRYSIVQGSRQSPYNMYSGALRIFVTAALSQNPIVVFEDGKQKRDFVNINDVVLANLLALRNKRTDFEILNVGGGKGYSLIEFATMVQQVVGPEVDIKIPGSFRKTDTRNAISDIKKLKKLGWHPLHNPQKSIQDYVEWFTQSGFQAGKLIVPMKKLEKLGVVTS